MGNPLDDIKNKNKDNEPNIHDVNSYYPEGVTPPAQEKANNPFTPNGMDLSDQVTSPGALRPEDYNPVNHTPNGNIYKGSYSGSIVGNIPIFVDNQDISFAPTDAREQALQIAASKKSKEIKQLTDDMYKVPQLKNAPDQPEMNDVYLNGIGKWKQMYGGDVQKLQQDPKFQAWQNDVKTAGRINDAAYEQYAQMGKDMDEGKKYFSEQTRKDRNAFDAGLANLGDPSNPQSQNFTAKAFKLNQSYDLDLAVNDVLAKYKPEITESAPEIKKQGIYDTIITKKKTNEDRKKIDALGEDLYKSKYEGTGTFTKEEVMKRVHDALPLSEENQVQTHNNQFSPNASAGAPETYSFDQKEDLKNVGTTSRKGNGETSFEMSNVYKVNATDQAKKVRFPVSKGIKYTDGKPVDTKNGYAEGSISEIGVAPVYKPGLKLPIKTVDEKGNITYVTKDVGGMAVGSVDVGPGTDAKSPSLFSFKPVAMFNVTENQSGAGGKNAANKTIVTPLSEVVGYYQKAGKKQGELDLTDMAADVTKQAKIQDNERLQKVIEYAHTLKNEKTTPATQKKSVPSGNKGGLKPTGDL